MRRCGEHGNGLTERSVAWDEPIPWAAHHARGRRHVCHGDNAGPRWLTRCSYGFQTNTHVKILLMLQLRDDPLSDVDVVTMFKAIHAAYVAYISNPFAHTLPGELPGATDADDTPVRPAAPPSTDDASRPIWSAAFERRIDAIAGWRPTDTVPTEAA